MTHTITREFLRQQRACYYEEEGGDGKVDALVPAEGLTALQVARLEIPDQDRIWVLTRTTVLADSVLWEWAARTVERALGRIAKPEQRSLAVVLLLRRLSGGENVPKAEIEEIRAASAAAAASAYAAAASAASNAAYAYAAASAAAYTYGSQERKEQISDIISILETST